MHGAHAVLVLTEWEEFTRLDFKRVPSTNYGYTYYGHTHYGLYLLWLYLLWLYLLWVGASTPRCRSLPSYSTGATSSTTRYCAEYVRA